MPRPKVIELQKRGICATAHDVPAHDTWQKQLAAMYGIALPSERPACGREVKTPTPRQHDVSRHVAVYRKTMRRVEIN